ncbi:hypothetical protein F8M41_016747 [Gigaspora margarita]|uniref:RING-type domain-containing protein n=1 Tax=Gigaspora margarita TaxID=4874 RepID=A0A8H4EUF3_GIGMA|nr:hypothetical protein F8M41_016747 [Gigaspora margarita]
MKVKIVKAKVGSRKVNCHLEPGFLGVSICTDKPLKKISGKISRKLTPEEKDNLSNCSECGKEIISHPLKAFTALSCGHVFHRICIEKKLLLTVPNTCLSPGCGDNVEILDQADALGTISDLPLYDPKRASQSSGISPLMSETFALFSPPVRMEEIKGTATQQVKSNLRSAKCSEDLFLCLPPIGFLRFSPQPQSPSKPLIYLTCKHTIYYNCIDNPRKLCPICPSTDMEPEEKEEMSVDSEKQTNTSSKKHFNEGMDVNSSTPKKKAKKAVRREDSPILKKLIKELSAPILQQSSSGSIISLQTFSDMDINSVNFYKLDDKIINAENKIKKLF